MLWGKYWQMPLYGLIGENLFLAAEILSCCPYTGWCAPALGGTLGALWMHLYHHLHHSLHSALCITLHCASLCALCTTVRTVHCASLYSVQNCVLATLSAPLRKKLTHSLATCAAPLYAPSLLLLLQFHGFQREVWLDWPCHVAFAQQTTYFLQGCWFERNHAWSGLSDKWVTDGQRVELGMTAATINWTHNWPPWATLCTTGAKSLKTSANNWFCIQFYQCELYLENCAMNYD